MRVPYPMGFFAKGMDGRIDDAKAGWKGRGVFTTWGTRSAVPQRDGKRNHAQGGSLPDSNRSAGALTRIAYAAKLVLGWRLTFCGKATSAKERNPPWVAAIPTLQTRKYPRGRRRRALWLCKAACQAAENGPGVQKRGTVGRWVRVSAGRFAHPGRGIRNSRRVCKPPVRAERFQRERSPFFGPLPWTALPPLNAPEPTFPRR